METAVQWRLAKHCCSSARRFSAIGAKLEAIGSDVARVADDAIYMHTAIDLAQVRASLEVLLDDVYAGIAESRTIMQYVTSFAQAVSGAPTGAGTSRLP